MGAIARLAQNSIVLRGGQSVAAVAVKKVASPVGQAPMTRIAAIAVPRYGDPPFEPFAERQV